MDMLNLDINLNIGVRGGMMVLGIALMFISAVLDVATHPGTFAVPFYVGVASLVLGFVLKLFGVGD
jgi:hypothetical protein